MARVDHDPVAPLRDGGQPRRIHRRAARCKTSRRSPSRSAATQITFADVIQSPSRQAGEVQLPAVRGRAAQLQLIRIKPDPRLELHHQTRCPGTGFTQADLLDGATAGQTTGKTQLPREVDPHAGASPIAGPLKKRLGPCIPAGAQLEDAGFREGPGGQRAGGLGRQRHHQQTKLQHDSRQQASSAGFCRVHQPQNSAG